MNQSATSTSNGKSTESAPVSVEQWREHFGALMKSYQDFHVILASLLETSSGGSSGVPVSCSTPSDSQAA